MDNLPLVSIALCTYNGAQYLAQQLDTLLAQTYGNFEIIAVDDCSADDTHQILLDYSKKHPAFFVYRNETNKGFLKNFETALSYCKGELISFCDQDDLWHPEKITLTTATIGDNQFVYHDSELIGENNESLNKKMSDIFNFYRGDSPQPFLLDNCVSGHAMLIKRELLQHALPFNPDFYHDWWLAYVATNIGKIDFIPQCLVQYRQHQESNTDLLNLSNAEKKKQKIASLTKRLLQQKKWLAHCTAYPGNKDPDFVKTLYELYVTRFTSVMTFGYYRFLKKNADLLFYILKKSKKRKQKDLRKFMWGFKAKNFWYSYIKPDKDKMIIIE
jgi:glycosyltransferase involved in cell wall biosynthesis